MNNTGRAGRVRVERRLVTARHGAALLDRKQRIMADELDRLLLHADTVRQLWEEQAREAARWLQRAAALDGEAVIGEASPAVPATIEVRWGVAMGVTYPVDATCLQPQLPAAGGSSALSYATRAHGVALEFAVQHAAARRAVELLTAELAATRTRQRAVENRWIPRLEDELRTIRRRLEEQELEETLRVHWAAENNERRRGRPVRAGVPDETGSR